MAKRPLTSQEQVLVGLGALLVLLLVAYAVVTGITRDDYRTAKRSLINAQKEYRDALDLRDRYQRLGRDIEERKRHIAQRDPNFDLLTFIGEVEGKAAFGHQSVTSPIRRSFANEKYLRTRVTFTYGDKSLRDVVRFLTEIENPKHGIIINYIELEADQATGQKFTMRLGVSAISELRSEP
jgi:hypothetical protein